ncbi:TRAP transporter substrate-binding protein DctP [Amphritea sp. 1_MG-2023]|uniref:TRAP transporter substrate-binding protein DctP n=1 Tax=Amphritea sp. 1_MG-2023 TaxID=3062670 RepID=UPI0026E18DA8|nr:TRAP transporter substrate-binding protein DctP [Amphritea sp. 1_MG-2023]MDO6564368.1 TRAP transporter substrate-binding protein DctP [Amphritea sp. 1_MG-2023]
MKLKKLLTLLAPVVTAAAISMPVQADAVELKLATDSGAKGSPAAEAIEYWAAQIEERTQGTDDEIKVDIFYQDELGDQKEVFDLLVVGEVDLMLNWPLTSYDKKMGLRNTPYLFLDWEQAFDAYKQGGWLNKINGDIHADLGLKYFGAWPEGFAGVASRGRYATTIEGAKSMKVRVPSNFPNPQTLQALGYQATAITWGEVYTSIQTGVVDGDAGNTIYWDYEYFRDVLDYYVRTKHTFVTGALSMNMEVWDELSENQKLVISDAAVNVMSKQFKEAKGRDQHYVDQAVASGMKYIELNDQELRELAHAAREKVWPLMVDELGEDIVQQLKEQAPTL